jgi:hypothetical protein
MTQSTAPIKMLMLLSILIFTTALLKAQTTDKGAIKGSIIDEQKTSLPYATVVLKKAKDSSIYRTALSSYKGAFAFTGIKAGNYFIEISMIGFEKFIKPDVTVDDTETDLGVLTLKKATNMLAGVTIKAEVPLIERQIDKTVVNVENSITSEGSTVLEVMQKLPGVQVSPDGQISLNGKSGVNVYIDGKATYLSSEDLANLLSGMQSSSVQKIEIITNPSAKFDAAGTGGIINIVKKKNRKEGLNGSVNGSVGEGHYGKYNGGFTLSYKNENYNLFFNNTYGYNKGFFNKTVTSDILNANNSLFTEEASNNNNIDISKSYRPSLGIDFYLSKKTVLTFSGTAGLGLSNDQTTSQMDILDSIRTKTNHEGFTSTVKDKPFNYTTGIQLVHQLDTAGKELTIDADYSDYRNNASQYNLTNLYDAGGNFLNETNALLQQHRKLNIYAAKADYTQPLKNNGRLDAGWKSSYVKSDNDNIYYDQTGGKNVIDSTQSDYSINTENINAAYININKSYKKLKVQGGLRTEQTITKGTQLFTGQSIEQNYLQLFPSLFLDYKADDQNGFNIKLGRRTDRAAYSEMIPFRRAQTPTLYFQGNPNLRPQLSWHGEFTWRYQSAFFITFNYDIYHDYIRTIPFLDTNRVTITRRPINVQGAHSWEVDFGYSKKLLNWWSTDNTLSVYQNAFNGSANGFSLDNAGIPSIYLSTNNSFVLTKKISAEADFEYNSKRLFVTSTFGPYTVLSFGLKQLVWGDKGSITLNAHNILQSEGHNAIDRNAGLYQYSDWHFYTRSVSLNFAYRFGNGKATKARGPGVSEEQGRAGG